MLFYKMVTYFCESASHKALTGSFELRYPHDSARKDLCFYHCKQNFSLLNTVEIAILEGRCACVNVTFKLSYRRAKPTL